MCGCADVRMCGCADVRMCACLCVCACVLVLVRMCACAHVHVRMCLRACACVLVLVGLRLWACACGPALVGMWHVHVARACGMCMWHVHVACGMCMCACACGMCNVACFPHVGTPWPCAARAQLIKLNPLGKSAPEWPLSAEELAELTVPTAVASGPKRELNVWQILPSANSAETIRLMPKGLQVRMIAPDC
eukprot:3028204-Prymnesium_polylepis.1